MNLSQLDVANIIRTIIVSDLPTGPVQAFNAKQIAGIDRHHRRNVRVPAVVHWHWLFLRGFTHINIDEGARHV